jgi:preprotein translocase subunit SecD
MIRNPLYRLALIGLLLLVALWIDLSKTIVITNPFASDTVIFQQNVDTRLGLDLRGGVQVLMEADLPAETVITAESMDVARTIIENRTNALGVAENSIQVAGDRRIVGEFPGVQDPDAVLAIIQQTGLLEFVDTGDTPLAEGSVIETDFSFSDGQAPAPAAEATATGAGSTPTTDPAPTADGSTPTTDPTPAADGTTPTVYHTIMTGAELQRVSVVPGAGGFEIEFVLTPEGTEIFGAHTAANVNKFLTILLDKKVISSPRIESAITEGTGVITGTFTSESANAFAVQLRYGSLPIPLKIVETRIIGPSLGEDSLRKSLIAGLVGLTIVILFMLLYYRLPGGVAAIAILFYAAISFALFKWIPITLTLPGIAGFLLSTGSALDANILIFERIKEELRSGHSLENAINQGWVRARSSILDSNIATVITSLILFWFGSAFGASIVKGFSLTLMLGVAISLFTAIFVTRTLLALVLKMFKPKNLEFWFGI